MRAALLAGLIAALAAAGPAAAQQPVPRLAAPADCLTNPSCGVGLRQVYGLDVAPVFTPLAVADGGVSALDDGIAEVAVAFSTNPQVSRPDMLTLDDDRGMLGPDRLVPVVRRDLLRELGRRRAGRLRALLDRVSREITTLSLRALNQQVADGRLPEAVGGEFVEGNGLDRGRRRGRGPLIVIGHQSFGEAETLAHLYAAALRGAGYRVAVRDVDGFRPELVAALRSGRARLAIGYSRSLLRYLAPGAAIERRLRAPPAAPRAAAARPASRSGAPRARTGTCSSCAARPPARTASRGSRTSRATGPPRSTSRGGATLHPRPPGIAPGLARHSTAPSSAWRCWSRSSSTRRRRRASWRRSSAPRSRSGSRSSTARWSAPRPGRTGASPAAEYRPLLADVAAVGFGIAFPAVFFVLAALDVMEIETAFASAKWTGLGLIGCYGFAAGRLAGNSVLSSLLQALAVGVIGGVLIALKALIH